MSGTPQPAIQSPRWLCSSARSCGVLQLETWKIRQLHKSNSVKHSLSVLIWHHCVSNMPLRSETMHCVSWTCCDTATCTQLDLFYVASNVIVHEDFYIDTVNRSLLATSLRTGVCWHSEGLARCAQQTKQAVFLLWTICCLTATFDCSWTTDSQASPQQSQGNSALLP